MKLVKIDSEIPMKNITEGGKECNSSHIISAEAATRVDVNRRILVRGLKLSSHRVKHHHSGGCTEHPCLDATTVSINMPFKQGPQPQLHFGRSGFGLQRCPRTRRSQGASKSSLACEIMSHEQDVVSTFRGREQRRRRFSESALLLIGVLRESH